MAYDILVVDDEPGLREMVQGILAGAGYTVRLAGTCAQALQQSRAKLPDGVLLDVMLPDGDGFALLGQLRDLPICPFSSSLREMRTPTGSGAWAWGRMITSPSPFWPRSSCSA